MGRIIEVIDRSEFKDQLKKDLKIDPQKTVVITVDMQREYLDMNVAGSPVLPEEADRVLKYSKELLSFARKQKIPVIHVYVCHRKIEFQGNSPMGAFFKATRDLGLSQITGQAKNFKIDRLEGTPQCQVPSELIAEIDLHITSKRTMDCYRGTELDYYLQQVFKPEVVVLTGINTDTCVYSTAFATSNRKYKPVVISECTASMRGKDCHEMALELMSRGFVWVLTVSEFKEKVLANSRN